MRTGRPPEVGVKRDVVVCVRFSETEVDAIDAVRGGLTRSQFLRTASLVTVRAAEQ
jgi:hypothetical protein